MLVAFSVAPSGTGRADGSVADAVAAAVRVLRESGLPNRTDAMFTGIIDSEHGWHGARELGHPLILDENPAYVHAYPTQVGIHR